MKKLLIVLMFSTLAFAADRPGFHGMLLLGAKNIYVSHLPMYHNLHRYQAIWKVDPEASGKVTYLKDKASHPNELYTIAPSENFVLTSLAKNKPSFKAHIFRGHFERGGKQIASDVEFFLVENIHFHEFKKGDDALGRLSYIFFGRPGEQFLAHYISKAPNYDQILEVTLKDPVTKQDARILEGSILTHDSKADPVAKKEFLKEGENTALILQKDTRVTPQVTVKKQRYLEIKELAGH